MSKFSTGILFMEYETNSGGRLCHIVHGPHNQAFHALWNQLRDEHEQLVMKGYTGEGFLSDGRRLGGRKLPLDEARRLARVAAERRRTLTAGSGQKLGGAPLLKGTDVRKVIAEAAQRRIDVTQGCASGSSEGEELAEEASRNGFKTKAEEDDANERAIMQAYIEMIQEEEREKYGSSYVPPSQENPAGPRSSPLPPPVPERTKPKPSTVPSLAPPRLSSNTDNVYADIPTNDASFNQAWTCQICTLENPPSFLCCDVCGSERPAPPSATSTRQSRLLSESRPLSDSQRTSKPRSRLASEVSEGSRAFKPRTSAVESLAALERNTAKRSLGWICHTCGTFMETEWWTCAACGTMKAAS
jgi:rubrerythrin